MISSEDTRQRLIKKFWDQTTHNLNTLRSNLASLLQLDNKAVINTMFLAAHTLKGNLGMMQLLDVDLFELNAPASDLESLMLGLRNQEFEPNSGTISELESYLDLLENQLAVNRELQ
jgi:chemotaxis protein histidine kinase CheA